MLTFSGSECRESDRDPTQSSVPSSRPESVYSAAVDAACCFLSFRPRSEAEVRRRLMRRFPAELVDHVIEDLRSKNYVVATNIGNACLKFAVDPDHRV